MFVLFGPEVHCLKDFYALRHCYQELECLITVVSAHSYDAQRSGASLLAARRAIVLIRR